MESQEGKFALIIGPSGVGKSTVMGQLRERHPELRFARSATTRNRRMNEGDDVYRFVSDTQFDEMLKGERFLEWAKVHGGARYGTLIDEIVPHLEEGRTVLRDVDIQGFEAIQKNALFFPREEARYRLLSIFIYPDDKNRLFERITKRSPMPADEVARRMASVEHELAFADLCDVKVVNVEGQIDQTREEIEKVLGILRT